ncbi:MAG: hypothetical protein HY657_00260 [Acidobacteria bacterium]|nr:hypothetical protein [Acidobacteriota bacterium]
MRAAPFDEVEFFRAIHQIGARVLLIGRRALVLLGLPVLTADYDFWLAIGDIERLNEVAAQFDVHPCHTPDEARRRGRYVLENDEHIDVLIARAVPTIEGRTVEFEDLWTRRRAVRVADVDVWIPSLDDLILTKQFGARPKDLEDIRLLRILKADES